jgi:hypothetical protein
VEELKVYGYNYKLDADLLHPLVFEKLGQVDFYTTIGSIQADAFKNLEMLVNLNFWLISASNFYHKIGIEWINHLDCRKQNVIYIKIVNGFSLILQNPFYTPYDYPDRDLCLFASFPQQTGVNLIPYDYDSSLIRTLMPFSSCTSPLKWLGRRYSNFSTTNPADPSYPFQNCQSSVYTGLSNAQIDEKLALCNSGAALPAVSYNPDYYETRILSMFFIQLIPFVFIPCACLLGLLFNWKIIQTISQNKQKELKEDFYKYMSVNAKFNCLYCLVFVFYPMTSCNWNPSYYFCSSIYTAQLVQYYKIVVMAYFGEVVKMCANISYVMMTLNRFLLIGKDHAPWMVRIAKLEFKWTICGSFVFSAVVNIGHGWEYKAMTDVLFSPLLDDGFLYHVYSTDDFSYGGYSNMYYLPIFKSYYDYPAPNQSVYFFVYSIVYFCLNFVVFFVLNTGIEVNIVRRMHKELKEKRERMVKISGSDPSASTTSSASSPSVDKKADEDGKRERRVINMVILNGIFNFCLRLPELLVWLQYSTIRDLVMNLSTIWDTTGIYLPGFANFIVDLSYLAYILTFSSNFIIFYKFNTKFKEAVVFGSRKKTT